MDNPGFDILKEAFKRAIAQYDADDLKGRVTRTVASAAKAGVERGLEEFPQQDIKDFVGTMYKFLASREVAEGVSATARTYDADQIQGFLDQVVGQLTSDEGADQLAKVLKQSLDKTSPDQIMDGFEERLQDMPLPQQMMMRMVMSQVLPKLEEMKNMSEKEVAETIKRVAEQIPTDQIALQIHSLAQNVTPERVSAFTHNMTSKLPSGEVVAEIVHGVGAAALKQFNRAADPAAADAPASAAEFAADAKAIVDLATQRAKQGSAAPKTKKGGGFDFDGM